MPSPHLAESTTPPTARPTAGRLAAIARPMAAVLAAVLAASGLGRPAVAKQDYAGRVTEVKVEGNPTIAFDSIKKYIETRAGREIDTNLIEADRLRLEKSGLFSDVRTFIEKDPRRGGFVAIFRVVERPTMTEVEFRGHKAIKLKDLEDRTELKKGKHADQVKVMLALTKIKQLYEEKGYDYAEVTLLAGGKPGDRKVVFQIFEGPKCRVRGVSFEGNVEIPTSTLATKIKTGKWILRILDGKYHADDVEADEEALRAYYLGLGYFKADVRHVKRSGANPGDVYLTFVVHEGPQFKVREIRFEGNRKIKSDDLRAGMVMHSGKPFSDALREADRRFMEAKYGEIGCIDAQIEPDRRFTDKPDVVDIVYKIDEGEPYVLGHFTVKGNLRTREDVLRREAEMVGLVPGEPVNMTYVEKYKKRISSLSYFNQNPEQGRPIEIKLVNKRGSDKPYGDQVLIDLNDVARTRLQDPADPPSPPPVDPPADPFPAGDTPRVAPPAADAPDAPPADAPPADAPPAEAPRQPGPGFEGSGGVFDPPPDMPRLDVPAIPAAPTGPRGPAGAAGSRTPPIGENEPPGLPSLPGGNMTDPGPDRQEPFAGRSFVDLITQVDEASTGRLGLSVGVNSYQGLVGSLVIHERNFDLFNIPRSWDDLFSGKAFRGRGQDLRIELSPGIYVNRAVASFTDPYAFGLPIGFNAQAYAFNRNYPDFTDGRAGGRFSLGRQFGTSVYADVAFRAEDVNFSQFKYPAPAAFLAAEGHTDLFSLRPSIRYDNRNDAFAPNKGSYLEAAFEQGWGSFTFPKFTVEGRQYLTVGSRPDGTGKRFFTFRGYFGITGRDTPVYERFYAGDFRSLRGFAYRGVGPRELGVNVGGIMTALGSVEYQFPWTANDKLQQVVFCDFGTVEANYDITSIRVAVGTGLRVFLPQQMFGNLPLAFDFGVPVLHAQGDRTRLFTFFIGTFF